MIIALFAIPSVSAMAANLNEYVDQGSPEFKSDTWQNNEGNGEVFPLEKAFLTGPTRVVPGDEQMRFSASVNINEGNMEGTGPSIVNGSAVNFVVFPFKETVKFDSVSLKWNSGVRSYFLIFYTSMDGQNWTEVEITGNASKVTAAVTYSDFGDASGPAVECWKTVPTDFENNDEANPNILNLTFKQTAEAKYFRMALYGNDNNNLGADEVSHAWVSFGSLQFNGEVVVPAAATEPDAPEAAPAAVNEPAAPAPAQTAAAPAPRTADPIVLIALGSLISAAVIIKKRK
jgi:hypothetical protein